MMQINAAEISMSPKDNLKCTRFPSVSESCAFGIISLFVGAEVGDDEGNRDGGSLKVGVMVGDEVGKMDGSRVGLMVASTEIVGIVVGEMVGCMEGRRVVVCAS